MPEVSTVSSGIQIGAESTPGTGVAASKILNYLSLDPDINLTFNNFRPIGQKVSAAITPGQDSTTWAVTGAGSYSEYIYPFCSLFGNVTPTVVDTSAKLWTFIPLGRSEDVAKTYTVESGSATRARKASYVIFDSFELTVDRVNGCNVTGGSCFGQQYQDNITLTAAPTAVEDQPILPTHCDVFIDPLSANVGTTKLTRDFSVIFRCNNRFQPIWPLNSTLASYASHVEIVPTVQMEMTVEADTQGAGFLTNNARLGAIAYIRLSAVSTVLAGAATAKYQMLIDMAGKISAIKGPADDTGVQAFTYTWDAIYDAAWGSGQYLKIQYQNKTATL